ncbi:glycoside hydrolase family 15 protein [Micromonospora yasonensis]|uniref:glycoside hydrolase family 15 protein n=1 Tax=Micromonospora yasonensis TaxID=1128667 RepID=UPI003872B917
MGRGARRPPARPGGRHRRHRGGLGRAACPARLPRGQLAPARQRPFLLRYRPEHDDHVDGLPGGEGAFLACTFWLVDALHNTGRGQAAEETFTRLLDLRNDVGLLSEEYDPAAGRQLGNTPQAFSLVGLVNSARQLSGASTRTSASGAEQRTPAQRQPTA